MKFAFVPFGKHPIRHRAIWLALSLAGCASFPVAPQGDLTPAPNPAPTPSIPAAPSQVGMPASPAMSDFPAAPASPTPTPLLALSLGDTPQTLPGHTRILSYPYAYQQVVAIHSYSADDTLKQGDLMLSITFSLFPWAKLSHGLVPDDVRSTNVTLYEMFDDQSAGVCFKTDWTAGTLGNVTLTPKPGRIAGRFEFPRSYASGTALPMISGEFDQPLPSPEPTPTCIPSAPNIVPISIVGRAFSADGKPIANGMLTYRSDNPLYTSSGGSRVIGGSFKFYAPLDSPVLDLTLSAPGYATSKRRLTLLYPGARSVTADTPCSWQVPIVIVTNFGGSPDPIDPDAISFALKPLTPENTATATASGATTPQ